MALQQQDIVQLTNLLQYIRPDYLRLSELNAAPAKPQEGMIALADGTNWNPGSGAGFYGYYGGSWAKLG